MKRFILGFLAAAILVGSAVFANDFYNHSGAPATGGPGSSAQMRSEFSSIATGFDKLPSLSGNGNKALVVNGGGTAITLTTGNLSLAGNFTISGAFATTLTVTNTTTLTLPTTGTLATLAGAESLSTKTIVAPILSGSVTGTYTLAGTPTITAPILSGSVTGTYTLAGTPTITAPILSGSVTGTYTLAGTPTITAPTISSPVLSGTATGTYTLGGTPTITSPVINTGTVGAAPTADLGVANKLYADQHGFTTGDVKLTLKTSADTSWVLMNDGSIGSASSGATTRANADTSDLYTLIWTNVTDTWAPVAGGRGGSAAADFAANKALTLPKTLGRALAGYGTGTAVASGVDADADITANDLTVASNNTKWITGMPAVFTLSSGTITGLVTSTTYYVIRSSATRIQLASNLANAQNGTAIDFTAKSAPVWSLTHTYTARVLGEAVGEGEHAQSVTELLAHTHSAGATNSMTAGASAVRDISAGSLATTSTGGNAAMNNLQPTIFLNVMVKL